MVLAHGHQAGRMPATTAERGSIAFPDWESIFIKRF
jgi:hypothetical protein